MHNLLIVGAGYMSKNYINFLKKKALSITVVGNKKNKLDFLENKNFKIIYGGLEKFNLSDKKFNSAIVAVNEINSFAVTKKLIENKIKNILIEKPGAKNFQELKKIYTLSKKYKCKVFIAYNRRFYESINIVKKICKSDGGITSANFSFTEWIDKIKKLKFENYLLKKWFFFNSLHVIDLVFYLIGDPKVIRPFSGKTDKKFTKLLFVGSGITKKNIYFNYHSNWSSAGSWEINLYTKNKKIVLCPLEQIKIQEINSVKVNEIKFNKKLDKIYKPGIPNMIKSFLGNKKDLPLIDDYIKKFKLYQKISGFSF